MLWYLLNSAISKNTCVNTLNLSQLLTTKLQYANSLYPDEMPSNLASHQDLSCLTLRQHFHQL